MFYSNLVMADEWENYENTGTSFSSGKLNVGNKNGVSEDDWNDPSSSENRIGSHGGDTNESRERSGFGGGGDRGRGRGGRDFRRGEGHRNDGDRNAYGNRNRFDDNENDRQTNFRGSRGRGDDGGGFRNNDRNGDEGTSDNRRRSHDDGGERNSRGGGSRGGRGGYRGNCDDRNGDEKGEERNSRGGGFRGNRDDGNDRRNRSDDNGEDGVTNDKPREYYIPPEPSQDENEIFKSGIISGINFDKYDKIPINVSAGAPPAISTFDESGLSKFVLDNVRKSGYTKPTPIQKNAIPIIMAKRDLMACAQTGSGKTAAFLLPIINDLLAKNNDLTIGKPQALIISPTRELTIQIFEEARKFALASYLKVNIVYGGTAVRYQETNIAKGCHILVCTPGRLLDFVDKGYITFEDIRYIVLDEADRMLDMGFVPSVEKVMKHPTMSEEKQVLMFSATFPEPIQRLAGQFLNDYVFLAIGIVGGACQDVNQHFYQVTKFEKRPKLMEILDQEENPNGTMVFVETKRNADFLASFLSETRYLTTSIHGDRLQREREEALRDFRTGKMVILIATSVAARGLDIKNVSHVINYDMPKSIDEYVHRIGRTGRVGNFGKATSFFDPSFDAPLAPELTKILKQADQPVPSFLSGLDGYGGDGGGSRNNKFGSSDVRKFVEDDFGRGPVLEPTVQECDEEW